MLSLIFAPAHGSTAWDCRPPSVPCFLLFPPLIPGKPRVLGGGGWSSSASARCRSYRAAPTRRGRGAGPATSTVGPPVPASSDRRPARPWRFVWRPGVTPAGCAACGACDQPPRAPWASGRAGPPGVAVRAGGRSGGIRGIPPTAVRARPGSSRTQPAARRVVWGTGPVRAIAGCSHGCAWGWSVGACGTAAARRVGAVASTTAWPVSPGTKRPLARKAGMIRRAGSVTFRWAVGTGTAQGGAPPARAPRGWSVGALPGRPAPPAVRPRSGGSDTVRRPGHRLRGPGAARRPPPPAPFGRRASPGAARPGP